MPLNFVSFCVFGGTIFTLSLLLTKLMIRIGIQDLPIHRSSHKAPTPRGGGVAIAVSFAAGLLFLMGFGHLTYDSPKKILTLAFALIIVFLVALKDDLKGLSFLQKLFVQLAVSFCIVATGLCLQTLPLPYFGMIPLQAFGGILSVFWIIFFMNVFNFMDGLNGLASGVSLVAAFFCAFISFLFHETSLFYISFTLIFSTLGFFVFNFPHGKIFMGDVGSQFLGLIWSIMLFVPGQESHYLSIYTIPLLFFCFIYDVSFTVLRRLFTGESFWLAHRTHLFQLLNRVGYSHRQVTFLYLSFSFLQGIGAILLQKIPVLFQIFIFLPYIFMMVFYHIWLYKKVKEKTVLYRS